MPRLTQQPLLTQTTAEGRRLLWLVPLLTLLLTSAAFAKPQHPDYYKSLRNNAPEVLTVRVTSLQFIISDEEPYRPFVVTARVLSVSHSASGLKRGDLIAIGLISWPPGRISCAAPAPLLLPGWKGRIYTRPPTGPWFGGKFHNGRPILRPAAFWESYDPTRHSRKHFMIEAPSEDELERRQRAFGITALTK